MKDVIDIINSFFQSKIDIYHQFLIWGIPVFFKYLYNNYINKEEKLKFYISTYGQMKSPVDEIKVYNHNKHFNLIDFFINKVFRKNEYGNHFIILADSGMGKTTFLQMLRLKYNRKLFKNKKIYFFPLSNKRDLSEIRGIKKKNKSIILLDALDEDFYAVKDYQKRMNKILHVTQDFYKVIITCRTQFFPNEYCEPDEFPFIIYGTGNKKTRFCRIYISPFTDNDIKKFLNKKYKWRIRKIRLAKNIISKSHDLMARPMLLTYIDDFLDRKNNFFEITDIYEVLIEKWMHREATNFDLLSKFTHSVVMYMYENDSKYLTIDDILKICEMEELENINPILARTRSLLIRNGSGEYKFAHYSIYEYLLSYEAVYGDDSIREKLIRLDKSFNKIYFRQLSFKRLREGEKNLKFLDFSEDPLLFISLNNIDLKGANFYGASFKNSSLKEVNLKGANLNRACLEGTDLEGADLSECKLRNANLKSANLKKVDLHNTDLRGADIQGANLNGVKIGRTRIDANIMQYMKDNYIEFVDGIGIQTSYIRSDIEKD